jgi:hypothetical protein
MALTPGFRATNLTAGAARVPPTRLDRDGGPDQAALVVVGGLVGCWGVAG